MRLQLCVLWLFRNIRLTGVYFGGVSNSLSGYTYLVFSDAQLVIINVNVWETITWKYTNYENVVYPIEAFVTVYVKFYPRYNIKVFYLREKNAFVCIKETAQEFRKQCRHDLVLLQSLWSVVDDMVSKTIDTQVWTVGRMEMSMTRAIELLLREVHSSINFTRISRTPRILISEGLKCFSEEVL